MRATHEDSDGTGYCRDCGTTIGEEHHQGCYLNGGIQCVESEDEMDIEKVVKALDEVADFVPVSDPLTDKLIGAREIVARLQSALPAMQRVCNAALPFAGGLATNAHLRGLREALSILQAENKT